ncbi:hypothetical protein [Vallitalea sp.]|uniref:hypothetical protein n=1 Tax=Vallitalea sp. TaxID=1882829 RepID=UPI0025F068BF|nr:hypothetical protein [Vallitalea sp.]MCT4687020.1 hypothetical protein [Vallitalea sp.]
MEKFNLISGICSILGLIISIFTASKVIKVSKNIDNKVIQKRNKLNGSNMAGRDVNVSK